MKKIVETFRALGNETRLRIMRLLLTTRKELCICEIVDALKLAQYHISKHMRELKLVGLVKEREEGIFVYYAVKTGRTKFNRTLAKTIMSIRDKSFTRDNKKMRNRLSLRVKGKVVVCGLKRSCRR